MHWPLLLELLAPLQYISAAVNILLNNTINGCNFYITTKKGCTASVALLIQKRMQTIQSGQIIELF